MVNFPKSQPAPECLATEKTKLSGTYRCGDVLERLTNDFHNKCYLCEEKDISSMNIEHLIPHRGGSDRDLMFDWNNLFLACNHCNNTKSAKHEDILDCTNENQKVTDLIEFHINPFPAEKPLIRATSQGENNEHVQNTVSLLMEIYQGNTTNKQLEANNICGKIIKEICVFQKYLIKYKDNPQKFEPKIIKALQIDTPFTAFKIWIIKRNSYFNNKFEQFLP
jgi:5-methylcytosine-specific restriction endonuclease McrA